MSINKFNQQISICANTLSGNRIFCHKKSYPTTFSTIFLDSITCYPKAIEELIISNRVLITPCLPKTLDCSRRCDTTEGCPQTTGDPSRGIAQILFDNGKKSNSYSIFPGVKCNSNSDNEILENTTLEKCKEISETNNSNIVQMEGNDRCRYYHSSKCMSTQDSLGTTLYVRDDNINESDVLTQF